VIAEEDNSIIVVQGANRHVTPELLSRAKKVMEESANVLIQQEIPVETVRLCKQAVPKTERAANAESGSVKKNRTRSDRSCQFPDTE
jgi:hypothetical protein